MTGAQYDSSISRSPNRDKARSNSQSKRKKFMADMFTKDLKAGRINVNDAKLPFQNDGDRIARYGKGFSNLLHMAGAPQESTNINTH